MTSLLRDEAQEMAVEDELLERLYKEVNDGIRSIPRPEADQLPWWEARDHALSCGKCNRPGILVYALKTDETLFPLFLDTCRCGTRADYGLAKLAIERHLWRFAWKN